MVHSFRVGVRWIERNSPFAALDFFETSAKENINVKAVFDKLVDIICNKMAESLDKVTLSFERRGISIIDGDTPIPAPLRVNG